jgi:hypothetical protein
MTIASHETTERQISYLLEDLERLIRKAELCNTARETIGPYVEEARLVLDRIGYLWPKILERL